MKSFFLLAAVSLLSQASLFVHAAGTTDADSIELEIMKSIEENDHLEAMEREHVLNTSYEEEEQIYQRNKITNAVNQRTIDWRTSEFVERPNVDSEALAQKINEQVESGKLLEAEEADMYEKYLQVQMELSKETEEENERLYNINEGKRRLRSRR